MTCSRRQLAAAAAAGALMALTGCGERGPRVVVNDGVGNGESLRLTFFSNKYESLSSRVLDDVFRRFERLHPGVTVSYQGIKGRAYYEVLMQRADSGREDDLFFVDHDTAAVLEAHGATLDLSGVPEAAAYSPLMKEQMRGRTGVIRMLPLSVAAHGLYCNRDLLEARGLRPPKSWPEWKSQCEFFLADGVTPVIANNDSSLKSVVMGVALARHWRTGEIGRVFDEVNAGRRSLFDLLHPGIRRARELVSSGWVNAATALSTPAASEDLKLFGQGESPFLLAGAPAARYLKHVAPSLRFIVVPHPTLATGRVLVLKPDTCLAVSAGCARREEAVELARLLAQPENVERFVQDICSISPLAAGNQHKRLDEVAPVLQHYKEEKPMVIMSDTRLAAPVCRIGARLSRLLLEGADDAACREMMEREESLWRRLMSEGRKA